MYKKPFLLLFLVFMLSFVCPKIATAATIPTMHITLNNTDLTTITSGSKETRYPGNSISISDLDFTTYYENVEIKGRGNSTWLPPKKPFQLSFAQKTELLNLGASKKWVLLADAYDVTHLRNDLAFQLGWLLDMPFTNSGDYLELYIDGQYQGLYYLTPKIGINKNSVNLKNKDAVLAEIDNLWETDDYRYVSKFGHHRFTFNDFGSKDDEMRKSTVKQFRQSFDKFEQALFNKDWGLVEATIDVESFANYFAVYEIAANPDGLSTSFYMYQNGANDRIHAGPIWDHDLAFANPFFQGPIASPYYSWAQRSVHDQSFAAPESELFARLINFAEFRTVVTNIFRKKVFPARDMLNHHIDARRSYLENAASRDNQFWQAGDFVARTIELQDWLNKRLNYLEMLYGTAPDIPPLTKVSLNEQNFGGNLFYARSLADGSYQFIDLSTGNALQVFNPRVTDGDVRFMPPNNNDSQHWFAAQDGDTLRLLAKTSGLALTQENGFFTIQEYNPDTSVRLQFDQAANPETLLRQIIQRPLSLQNNHPATHFYPNDYCGVQENLCATAWLIKDAKFPQLISPDFISIKP